MYTINHYAIVLVSMLIQVNYTQMAPDKRLLEHVYEYYAKEHELFHIDRAEERAKQKEKRKWT